MVRFLLEHTEGKIFISVPTTSLIHQMADDFESYEVDNFVSREVYKLLPKLSLTDNRRVFISTWSLLYRQHPEFFKPFNCYIADEAHQAATESLGKIVKNLGHVPFRFRIYRNT